MHSAGGGVVSIAETTPQPPALLTRPTKFLMLLAELGLLLAVCSLYDVEGRRHFFPVLCLICAGAAVHLWLPFRLRLPFFAALSMGTVLFVLGAANGLLVLGLGGVLIAVCYLPLPFWVRMTVLAVAGAGLFLWRRESVSPIWAVLGSMFMFRLAIYLYDVRRRRERPPLAWALSYFFLLPNVCFPLFPVVDYQTFRATYYNEDEWAIYQRGVSWMLRGISHLLLYRFIKMYLVPEPYEIQDIATVTQFLVTNYMLYLQVSGQFHLITGVLHLFGFNLPRTHHLFFLASSVSDIWRRINIYWKDFLEKLIFLPSFFALRRGGVAAPAAIVLGVFAVFLSTWLLHSWQTFWLLGKFPVAAGDAVLWLGVGACVAANSLVEYRRAKRKSPRAPRPVWREDLSLALRIVGMFAAVSLFWGCWTRAQFLQMTASLLMHTPVAFDGWPSVLMSFAALVAAGMVFLALRRMVRARQQEPIAFTFRDTFAVHAIILGGMVSLGLPWFGLFFGQDAALTHKEFRSDLYHQRDPFTELQSYYEDLNTVAVQAGPLLQSLTPQQIERRSIGAEFGELTRRADPDLEIELIPGWSGTLDDQPFTINQFGMRDRRTITIEKPDDTVRIAFVGSSVVMGYSVADGETFSRLFEEQLNAAWGTPSMHFEVLNFGTGKHWALHRLVLVERKVLAFDPDVLFYFAHQDEPPGPVTHIIGLFTDRHAMPYAFLDDILAQAGITPDTPPGVAMSRLSQPERNAQILEGIYRTLVELCRSRGIVPVWVYLPVPGVPDAPDIADDLVPLAERAGFVVLNLDDWHAGYDPADLKPRANDHHLDARGHRIFAEQLFESVRQHPETLPVAVRRAIEARP